MRRRVVFWALVTSPVLVIGAGLIFAGVLELFGADCVTYGNNPMELDNETACNQLGDIQSGVGWCSLFLAIVLMPVAFVTGAAGAWRAVKRRSR